MPSNFKLDMNKLEKAIKDEAASKLNEQRYDVTCPHCGKNISVPTGKSKCPYCHNDIDLTLNIDFS